MVTQVFSGTSTIGAEWSCTANASGPSSNATAGKYQLFVDWTNLAAGDQYEVQPYGKIVSGGSLLKIGNPYVLTGAQASKGWATEEYTFVHGFDFTIKKNAGTDRSITWSIRDSSPLDAAGVRAAVGLGSANLDTQLTALKADTASSKTKTDSMTFTNANELDVNVHSINDGALAGTGIETTDEWRPA